MDSWTSKDALFRDLARAQGGAPIAITNPLLFNETPPRQYEEDKESEFQFHDASATTDFSEGPDLQMIMQMLEMVNDDTPESEVDISKPSGDASCIADQKSTVKKKNRNAAIESIIQQNKLKTEEITQNEITEKRQKCANPIAYSSLASSMFKKKTVSNKSIKSPKTTQVSPEILKTNTFVPSSVASSYYEKFVEFNEAKEIKNDIWSMVQKKLTEFEERKGLNGELTTSSDTETSEISSPPLVQESNEQ